MLGLLAAAVMAPPALNVLVFSSTKGFRHDSIPVGIATIQDLGRQGGWTVSATEDAKEFRSDRLKNVDVVVFLNTTGDVLNNEQQAAFQAWFGPSKGFVGVHAAADTEYDWPWYGQLVGAYFISHPRIQKATVVVTDRHHPATEHLEAEWPRTDEWYDYRSAPAPSARVLMRLNTTTYEGHRMGTYHPIAWCHRSLGGRSFYTGGGHTKESYAEPAFRQHLAGAIDWAGGRRL